VISSRERKIAMITGVVLALFALDYLVLSPLTASREQLDVKQQSLQRELDAARKTANASRTALKKFREYRAAGLSTDASATESSLLNTLRSWAQESNLTLLSLRPDRAASGHGLNELAFQASAEGSMRSIMSFLHRIDSASLPVRVNELQIASRTENSDDLTLQMRISTMWEDAKQAAPPKPISLALEGQR